MFGPVIHIHTNPPHSCVVLKCWFVEGELCELEISILLLFFKKVKSSYLITIII